jgi:hypothetical protein
MHSSLLDAVFTFTAQESPNFYLFNSISPVFQVLTHTTRSAMKNLSTVRIVSDTNSAVNFLDKHNR